MHTLQPILKAAGLAIAVAASSTLVYAGDAPAQIGYRTESVSVRYADLNLSSQAGIDALYARLQAAAAEVCAPEEDVRELSMRRDWRRCLDAALDQGVQRVDTPALTHMHLERTGRNVASDRTLAEAR